MKAMICTHAEVAIQSAGKPVASASVGVENADRESPDGMNLRVREAGREEFVLMRIRQLPMCTFAQDGVGGQDVTPRVEMMPADWRCKR